jgi:ribosomal peptide maturation radical SAM protein 1
MYKIALVNMPFAALEMPSFALTLLKSRLDSIYSGRVSCELYYLNQDFAQFLGPNFYQQIAVNPQHHNRGLGEWFFRQAAFPELPDNAEKYFRRYYPIPDEDTRRFKLFVLEKRAQVPALMETLIDKYRLDEAQIVGLTSMFSQNAACFALARALKRRNPGTIIVMGGANCETPMGQEIVKNVESVDFIFSGPSLINFPQFIQYCTDGELSKCHRMAGVFSRRNCVLRKIAGTVDGYIDAIGPELDINDVIQPNYAPFLRSIKEHFPHHEVRIRLFFETSRGCWWGERSHCTFCGLNGLSMNYRAMRPDKAIAYLNSLFQYAPECSQFDCVDNIIPRNYFKEVLPFLNTPPNVTIFYEIKADVSEEDVKAMQRARVKFVQPGIEALSTSTLKLMKKGTTAFQNLRLLKNCVLYDVYPSWNLLLGFPGEDENTYRKYVRDLPLFTHLPPPAGAFVVRFDRFSPYFTRAQEFGLDLQPNEYYEMIFPFSRESLKNFAYYFTNQNYKAEYLAIIARWINKILDRYNAWEKLWHGEEQQVYPRLFIKESGNETLIYDSRSGEAVEYRIGSTSKELLERLSQPKRLSDLAHMQDIASMDLTKEIEFLQDKGLLFEEEGRFLSLVLPREYPPMSLNAHSVYEVKERQPAASF